jgi:HPt (histidine-containing phosphotransfer) domain-containing protein
MALERLLGKPELTKLVMSFRQALDNAIRAMSATSERQRIASEVHALVSYSGNLGCSELSSSSRRLMDAIRDGNRDLEPLAADISAAADRARAAMDERFPAFASDNPRPARTARGR